MDNSLSRSRLVWLPTLLMIAALVLRVLRQHHVIESLPNLSPLMAFAFAGSIVFPRPLPWWSWVAILLGVDLASQGFAWWSQASGQIAVLSAYACFAAAAFAGSRLRERGGIVETLLGTLACSTIFYLVTNTVSWITDPLYARTFAGWWQALTLGTGLPGIPTTLEFFRNSLVADLAGAALLVAVYNGEALARSLRTIPWLAPRRAAFSAGL